MPSGPSRILRKNTSLLCLWPLSISMGFFIKCLFVPLKKHDYKPEYAALDTFWSL